MDPVASSRSTIIELARPVDTVDPSSGSRRSTKDSLDPLSGFTGSTWCSIHFSGYLALQPCPLDPVDNGYLLDIVDPVQTLYIVDPSNPFGWIHYIQWIHRRVNPPESSGSSVSTRFTGYNVFSGSIGCSGDVVYPVCSLDPVCPVHSVHTLITESTGYTQMESFNRVDPFRFQMSLVCSSIWCYQEFPIPTPENEFIGLNR